MTTVGQLIDELSQFNKDLKLEPGPPWIQIIRSPSTGPNAWA